MMIALSLSNLLDFSCNYMWHLQFVVVMLCYIISLRPVRYIVLRTLSFISLRPCLLCVMFHSHFDSFAMIPLRVSNLFFLFVLACDVSTSLRLIGSTKEFLVVRNNL